MKTFYPVGHRVMLYLEKLWGDPDYDILLNEFCRLQPSEFDRWLTIEKRLFETRTGRGPYPDQPLMQFCWRFIEERSTSDYGRLGVSNAWRVLRGRILRGLIEEAPELHPSPGKPLITEPRTLSDEELSSLAHAFGLAHPMLWSEWQHIEREGDFGNDLLGPAAYAFRHYLRDHCWVQCTTAASSTFLDVRGLIHRTTSIN